MKSKLNQCTSTFHCPCKNLSFIMGVVVKNKSTCWQEECNWGATWWGKCKFWVIDSYCMDEWMSCTNDWPSSVCSLCNCVVIRHPKLRSAGATPSSKHQQVQRETPNTLFWKTESCKSPQASYLLLLLWARWATRTGQVTWPDASP